MPSDVDGLVWLDASTRLALSTAVAAGPRRALLLAVDDEAEGLLAGVVAADLPPWRGRKMPWIWLVEVEPSRRGRGLGTALLETAHRVLAARGESAVELSVDDDNPAAGLYRRLGYDVVGAGVDPPDGRPWTRMRRPLVA